MKFLRYYCHEIYSVITVLLILVSAIFVTPDSTQVLALVYAFLFLLHEWEENNYPGGFFNMLFGEIVGLNLDYSGDTLRESRRFVYILLIVFTFTPYIFHTYTWLILPIVYLGLVEGLSHSIVMPRVLLRDRRYTPGMVTAICQFIFSVGALGFIIYQGDVAVWQYIVSIFTLLLGLMFMAFNGIRSNGVNPKDIPKIAKKNIKALRSK